MKLSWQDAPNLLLVLAALSFHLWVGLPYVSHDCFRNSEYRFSRHHDEGNNTERAYSARVDGFENLKNSPRGQRQLYFFISRLPQSVISIPTDLKTKVMMGLRLTSVWSFVGILVLFYFLARFLFPPWISLWLWTCFVAGAGHYVYSAYHAKEDMLSLVLVIGTLLFWISWTKDKQNWKWTLSTVLIGLGAAVKLYPLLLTLLYFPFAFYTVDQQKERIRFLLKSFLVTFFTLFIVNPNYYLSFYHFKGFIWEYGIETMATEEPTFLELIIRYFKVLNYVVLDHLGFIGAISLLLVVARLAQVRIPKKDTYDFLVRNKEIFFGFIALYYAVSVFKQHIHIEVKYFLIGEIFLLVWMGGVLQRLLAISNPIVRSSCLIISGFLSVWFCLLPGAEKYALTFSRMARDWHDSRHSTSDLLVEYLRTLPLTTKRIFAEHGSVIPSGEFDPVFGWGVNLKAVREITQAEIVVTKKWPDEAENSWNMKTLDKGDGKNCLRLLKSILPVGEDSLEKNAVFAYRSLLKAPNEKRVNYIPGPFYAIYDSRECL